MAAKAACARVGHRARLDRLLVEARTGLARPEAAGGSEAEMVVVALDPDEPVEERQTFLEQLRRPNATPAAIRASASRALS